MSRLKKQNIPSLESLREKKKCAHPVTCLSSMWFSCVILEIQLCWQYPTTFVIFLWAFSRTNCFLRFDSQAAFKPSPFSLSPGDCAGLARPEPRPAMHRLYYSDDACNFLTSDDAHKYSFSHACRKSWLDCGFEQGLVDPCVLRLMSNDSVVCGDAGGLRRWHEDRSDQGGDDFGSGSSEQEFSCRTSNPARPLNC